MKKMDMHCFGMWHLVEEDNGERYLVIKTYTNDGKKQEMRVEVNEQEIRLLQTVIEQSRWGKKESEHVTELEKIAKFRLECMDRMSEENKKLYDANKKLKEEIEEKRKYICNLIQARGDISTENLDLERQLRVCKENAEENSKRYKYAKEEIIQLKKELDNQRNGGEIILSLVAIIPKGCECKIKAGEYYKKPDLGSLVYCPNDDMVIGPLRIYRRVK